MVVFKMQDEWSLPEAILHNIYIGSNHSITYPFIRVVHTAHPYMYG